MAQTGKKLWIIFVIAMVALGIWAWRRSVERSVPTVRTHKVSRQDIRSGVTTSAKAAPVTIREIRAAVGGLVSRVPVQVGDKVKAGQVLAELSAEALQSEAAQAESELAGAQDARRLLEAGGTPAQLAEMQAQVDQAKRVRDQADALLKQSERLAEKGAIARVELEQARQAFTRANADLALAEEKWKLRVDPAAVQQSEARIHAAKAALDLAESRLGETTIRSSIAGVVYSLPVRVGDYAEVNSVVARVGDTSKLSIAVFVDEPDLGRISLGQEVLIRWDGLPDRSWTGKVERTPAQVESTDSRTGGEVLASVDNSSGELLPNTNLTVEIVTSRTSGVLAIPREALESSDGTRFVWLVAGDRAEKRTVETGLMNTTDTEIVKGLAEGDVVVLRGEQKLADGMKIKYAAN
jgi:HlyD family secretion protein